MKRIISILLENKPGALARVVGLFHQRGYNIESLNVGPIFDGSYSRMTVTTRGSENDVEQITKQINKIIDVIKVSDLTEGEHHEYEFILIKYNKFKLTPKIQKVLKPLTGKVLEKNTNISFLGMQLRDMSIEELEEIDLSHGVKVSNNRNSSLYRMGIREGYILTEINSISIKKTDDLSLINSNTKINQMIFFSPEGEKERLIFE